jgi:hypothetical protein
MTISSRVNFFDGQNITEEDLDTEQTAWHDTVTSSTNLFAGSGVEKSFIVQRTLFDSDDVPASIQSLIDTQNFDGEPIYPEDSFSNTVFLQPSDSVQGNQLDIRISGSSLDGTPQVKVFIFGTTFGGDFKQEAFTFRDNGTQITRNYYTSIVAIMTQDFRGNQNNLIDGVASRNNGGRLEILEALPMRVARDAIMAEQKQEPNQDYKNFKPATLFKTLDILLDEIAATEDLNADDLNINITSTSTRKLEPNESGIIIGEKFQATTDNIQKITILLSVEERTLVPAGEEFDWSGDIVVGIRKLQTTTVCPTDTIPGTEIEFDPEPSSLAEVSFDMADLEALGIVLNDEPQEVDFIFTQSLISNPSVEPSIIPDDYYILTIRRSGDLSTGTIILEEAANTNADPDETDNMRMSVFAQNTWTDVPESDLWFKIYTGAVRIVDGTAVDDGVQITSPKVKENEITSIEEVYIEGNHSLIDISENAENYVIVQGVNNYSVPKPHPSTGNLIFTRIEDVPEVAVVSESTLTTLLDAGNETIILGMATDTNPIDNPVITGTSEYPGLHTSSTFTVINPSSDLINSNVIGSILVPNTNDPSKQYRIIKKEVYTDLFGDVNGDGEIDDSDIVRCQEIGNVVSGDGYSKDLASGLVPSSVQVDAVITQGTVLMEEILRADVNADDIITVLDSGLIQQFISLGTAFPAGSSFTRIILTVENLTDPLSTTPDIIGSDPDLNAVPFTSIPFRIDFIPLWVEENIVITDLRRFVTKTFTSIESTDITGGTVNGGTNTTLVPGDMLLGGSLLDEDANVYSIDLEVGTVTLELPEGSTAGEVDVFNSFIKNQMRFSDGTLVGSSALDDDQVRVTASVQSIAKDLDGYDYESEDGSIKIDETVSVLYTESTGLLRIRAGNIRNISTRPELRTKIILTIYLKKAGFQNAAQTISESDLSDYLTSL